MTSLLNLSNDNGKSVKQSRRFIDDSPSRVVSFARQKTSRWLVV
jgi:hypothetical protein